MTMSGHNLTLLLSLTVWISCSVTTPTHHDVVVYGATPSGVMSAVSAGRNKMSVGLVAVQAHVGGMCASGLGNSDIGSIQRAEKYIGGLAREFFDRNGAHYGKKTAEWLLEPHVAENIFLEMLHTAGVVIYYNNRLSNVLMNGTAIDTIYMENGNAFKGSVFIDSTYEGDLMAAAGVSFTVGREANTTYNEPLAGVTYYDTGYQFQDSTVVRSQWPNSTILPLVTTAPRGQPGQGDTKVQAYNFRLCITQNTSNLIPFSKPPGYNAETFKLLGEYVNKYFSQHPDMKLQSTIGTFRPVPNGKYDLNTGGPVSFDFVGKSWEWPTATWTRRDQLWQEHKQNNQGILWFLSNDNSVPKAVREQMRSWGLCKDEFTSDDENNWPWNLYVREGRRMVSNNVWTEHNVANQSLSDQLQCIGIGTYHVDIHVVQRPSCQKGTYHCHIPKPGQQGVNFDYALNEGCVFKGFPVYQVPFWMTTPKSSHTTNLFVGCAFSASHIGFAAVREEPLWMTVGHSVGTAASLVVSGKLRKVTDVSLSQLHHMLLLEHQILDLK